MPDSDKVTIRPAVPSDVEALVAMRLAIEEHMILGNPDIWRMSAKQRQAKKGDYLTDLANDQKRVLVALDGAGRAGRHGGRLDPPPRGVPARPFGAESTTFGLRRRGGRKASPAP